MTSSLDKLNLRPQERRLVVGILVVVFVVLNVLLVWPHFGDWVKVRAGLAKAQGDLVSYRKKIAQVSGPNGFEVKLKKLEGEGVNVAADEQDVQLLRTVQSQVAESKITVTAYGKVTPQQTIGKTNEFFEEQFIQISVNTGEKELVDFLLKIGSGSSMIRVRDLDLKPADQNRYRLQGRITLSANYQKKKPAARSASAGAKTTTPAIKPPASVVKKP